MRRDNQRRIKKKASSEGGAPAWMVTYSDMITLILAFFVLLFSFAVIDAAQFNEIMSSIRVTFLGSEGILQGAQEPADTADSFLDVNEMADITKTVEQIQAFIEEKGLEGTMSMQVDKRGVTLEVSDVLFFDSGEARLKPIALEILDYISELLQTIDNSVIVEGHTDNVPIRTSFFPSNWELSVTRAVVVVRYLVEARELSPDRFMAVGFGEFQPKVSNSTADGRAKNRRVNIIIEPPDAG